MRSRHEGSIVWRGVARPRPIVAALAAIVVSSCSLFVGSKEVAHDWAVTAVGDNTLTLVVAVGSGTCDRFDHLDLTETSTEVTITAMVVEHESGTGVVGGGCTDDLELVHVDVALEEPLGDRTLSGCAPGSGGLEDYFGTVDGGRSTDDCAEIVDGW